MELRICDFRNSKYQGQTLQREPAGFGLALDENYSFLMSEWQNGAPVGPFAIIFDDSCKLYGLEARDEILVFVGLQCKIYKSRAGLVIDCPNAKYLLKVEDSRKLPPTPTSKNRKTEQRIKIVAQKRYNQSNYQQILTELLQLGQLPNRFSSYQSYIKETFKTRHRDLLNIFQSSKQFSVSLNSDSIFVKMAKSKDRILSCGFVGTEKKVEIGRKYSYYRDEASCVIEEFIETQQSTFVQFQRVQDNCKDSQEILGTTLDIGGGSISPIKKLKLSNKDKDRSNQIGKQDPLLAVGQSRPKESLRNLRQYYKRSLTFINKYLNLAKFYSMREQFQQLFKQVKGLNNGKYAQVQLEDNGYRLDEQDKPIVTKDNEVRPKEYDLEDWKKELDRTKTGGKRDRSTTRSTAFGDLGPVAATVYEQSRRTNQYRRASPQSPARSRVTIQKQGQREKQLINPYTPIKDRSRRNERANPQRDPNRSKSQRKLKYLDSQSQAEKGPRGAETRYDLTRYEPLYKDTGSLYKGSQRRTPIAYKFNYTGQNSGAKEPRQESRVAPGRYQQSRWNGAVNTYDYSNY